MAIEECPSRTAAALIWVPPSSQATAALCLNVWTPTPSISRLLRREFIRRALRGSTGVPISVANTRSWSFHTLAARSRSATRGAAGAWLPTAPIAVPRAGQASPSTRRSPTSPPRSPTQTPTQSSAVHSSGCTRTAEGTFSLRLVESSDPEQVVRHNVRSHFTQRLILVAAVCRELQYHPDDLVGGRPQAALNVLSLWMRHAYDDLPETSTLTTSTASAISAWPRTPTTCKGSQSSGRGCAKRSCCSLPTLRASTTATDRASGSGSTST